MFTHPHILVEVARERQQELRAEARQYRRASQASRAGSRTDTAARGAPAPAQRPFLGGKEHQLRR